MSRRSETEEICQRTSSTLLSLYDGVSEEKEGYCDVSVDEMNAAQGSAIINLLMEISVSLAVIADSLSGGE